MSNFREPGTAFGKGMLQLKLDVEANGADGQSQ
jgi:hypothetical protein